MIYTARINNVEIFYKAESEQEAVEKFWDVVECSERSQSSVFIGEISPKSAKQDLDIYV